MFSSTCPSCRGYFFMSYINRIRLPTSTADIYISVDMLMYTRVTTTGAVHLCTRMHICCQAAHSTTVYTVLVCWVLRCVTTRCWYSRIGALEQECFLSSRVGCEERQTVGRRMYTVTCIHLQMPCLLPPVLARVMYTYIHCALHQICQSCMLSMTWPRMTRW